MTPNHKTDVDREGAKVQCRVCTKIMEPAINRDAPCWGRHTVYNAVCPNCGLTPAKVLEWYW